ncbi:MAG: C1 family peptidase [Elusimicrobiales bacterium]|nr:C1 family peptidase [Elusimicrobiales bacterium]
MKNSKKMFAGFSALLAVALLSAMSFAQDKGAVRAQIDGLNKAIQEKGGKWVAGETSLSNLSEEELMLRVGLDFQPLKAAPLSKADLKGDVPPSIDWRSNGGNFVSGIRNQAKCGSCWAFSMTAALESYLMRVKHTSDPDLSEQVMLSCSGVGTCKGGQLHGDFLKTTGLPPESDYPYIAQDGNCASAAAGWQDRAKDNRVVSVASIGYSLPFMPVNIDDIKAALVKFGPLPTAYFVYEDFKNYKSGVYSYTTGKKLGGHAVLLVGYNDAEQYFIVKNSWGTNWGEDGFFKIAYSQSSNEVKFGMMTIALRDVPEDSETKSPLEQKISNSMFNPNTERLDSAVSLKQLSAF